jgi:hypothetical protein
MKDPYVFISSAQADVHVLEALQGQLEAAHVRTWSHHRNVRPGALWERELTQALEGAAALVVIVSKASKASDWVHAEVEYALQRKMKVVPVTTDDVELPIRWRMSQWIDWSQRSQFQFERLVKELPSAALRQFADALAMPGNFDTIRALLRKHPNWLPMEYGLPSEHLVRYAIDMAPHGFIDCFVDKPDISPQGAGCLYYFASPYESPVTIEGELTGEVKGILDCAREHVKLLREEGREALEAGRRNWEVNLVGLAFNRYSVSVRIIAGQRHFNQRQHDTQALLRSWGLNAELLSYTRLLQMNARSSRSSSG